MLRNGAEGVDSLNFIGMLGYISSSCKGAGRGEEPQHKTSRGSAACCCRAPSHASSPRGAGMQHPEHGPAAAPPRWERGAGLSGGPPRTEPVPGRAGAHLGKEGREGGGVQTEFDVLRDLREEDGYCPATQRGAGAGSAPRAPRACSKDISAPALRPAQLHGEVWRRTRRRGALRVCQPLTHPTSPPYHGVCDFKDQCPSRVVGEAGGVEEVAGDPEVNHAAVIGREGQRWRREGDGGVLCQGEAFALEGREWVKQGWWGSATLGNGVCRR